jgi:thiamine pyrophosphate-dependent acetolactate synthase large subunit-like protein
LSSRFWLNRSANLTDALLKNDKVNSIRVRREETAAFAASAILSSRIR